MWYGQETNQPAANRPNKYPLKCCIPACDIYVLSAAYKLCSYHWNIYCKGKKRDEWEPWLLELIRMADRDAYAYRRDLLRITSLDGLLEKGLWELGILNSSNTSEYTGGPSGKYRRDRRKKSSG